MFVIVFCVYVWDFKLQHHIVLLEPNRATQIKLTPENQKIYQSRADCQVPNEISFFFDITKLFQRYKDSFYCHVKFQDIFLCFFTPIGDTKTTTTTTVDTFRETYEKRTAENKKNTKLVIYCCSNKKKGKKKISKSLTKGVCE